MCHFYNYILCFCLIVSIQTVYVVAWSRDGARLPAGASDRNGELLIRSAQPSDGGTYICTGSNQFERKTQTVSVRVIPRGPVTRPPQPPGKSAHRLEPMFLYDDPLLVLLSLPILCSTCWLSTLAMLLFSESLRVVIREKVLQFLISC